MAELHRGVRRLTGGEIGLTIPACSHRRRRQLLIGLCFMTISATSLRLRSRHRPGTAGQRTGPVQAGALGFNIVKHKLAAFVVSAFLSGLSGALLVFYSGPPRSEPWSMSRSASRHRRRGPRRTAHGAWRDSARSSRSSPAIPAADRRTRDVHRLDRRAAGGPVFPGGFLGLALARQARSNGCYGQHPPLLEVRGLTKCFGEPRRGQEPEPRSARRRDLRPDRPEWLGQVDRDEGDHGHRAPDRGRSHLPGRKRRRSPRAQDRAQGFRHGVPAFTAAKPADRAGEHHGRAAAGQPVHAVCRQGADRARQMDRQPRRPRRRDGSPAADLAVRGSAPA